MLTLFFCLVVLSLFFGIGFAITGALISAIFWACVKLPMGLVLVSLGLALCCTLILIPLGKPLLSAGFRLILPGI